MAKRLTKKEVDERFETLYNGEYELISEYINNGSLSTIRHKTCGNVFTTSRLTRFFDQSYPIPCTVCRKLKAPDMTPFKDRFLKEYGQSYEIINYATSHGRMTFKCKKCNNNFSLARASDSIKNNWRGCPYCNPDKKGKFQQPETGYLESLIKDEPDYVWLELYKNDNKIKHMIKHLVCGMEYSVRPNSFQQGNRCPYCTRQKSQPELAVYNYISSIYSGKIIQSDRREIHPYELDMYLPDLKIAVEFHGLFWHQVLYTGRDYHRKKFQLCQDKGIRLIQIFEDEWKFENDRIKKFLSKIILNKQLPNYELINNSLFYNNSLIGTFSIINNQITFSEVNDENYNFDILKIIKENFSGEFVQDLRFYNIDENYKYEILRPKEFFTNGTVRSNDNSLSFSLFDAGSVKYLF